MYFVFTGTLYVPSLVHGRGEFTVSTFTWSDTTEGRRSNCALVRLRLESEIGGGTPVLPVSRPSVGWGMDEVDRSGKSGRGPNGRRRLREKLISSFELHVCPLGPVLRELPL